MCRHNADYVSFGKSTKSIIWRHCSKHGFDLKSLKLLFMSDMSSESIWGTEVDKGGKVVVFLSYGRISCLLWIHNYKKALIFIYKTCVIYCL